MTSTALFNISGRLLGNINLGPLITTFTPPPYCLSNLYLVGSNTTLIAGSFSELMPTSTFPTLGWPTQTECYPPGYQETSSAFRALQGATPVTFGGYFSPGACPAGYTSACPEEIMLTSAGEEIAICCPRGYKCWVLLGSCISAFTTNHLVTYVSPTSDRVTDWYPPDSYYMSSGSALATQIQVRRAASDSVDWPADPTITQPPKSPPTTEPQVSGLAKPLQSLQPIGPAIYLSVGIPSALIVLACLFYFVRVYRARRKAAAHLGGTDIGIMEKAELAGDCILPQEGEGTIRLELDTIGAVNGPAELETPIAELPAPWTELDGLISGPLPIGAAITDEARAMQRGNI